MRIATWNIQTARPTPDGPADVDGVAACLRSLGADVVALQEVDRGLRRSGGVDQALRIADALEGRLVWAPTVRREGEYGIALVVQGEVVRLHEAALGGRRERRALLVAEVDAGGARWTVGCTHLSRDRRLAQQQLQRALDELRQGPLPRVLVGDLNLTARHVLPWSTAAGYHLVDGPPTHSLRQPRPTVRIDHVLVAGARVDRAETHRLPFSDHAAVVVNMRQIRATGTRI